MEYRTLGRTGLRVSEIGLGGEWFNGLTAEESSAIVDAAQQKGDQLYRHLHAAGAHPG